jgi:hypothetical protein
LVTARRVGVGGCVDDGGQPLGQVGTFVEEASRSGAGGRGIVLVVRR